MLHVYNSLTRSKDRFKPLRDREVKFYACGPTVYNHAHIGNLRTYTSEDIIIRILRFLGYRTEAVMNITDIDDKTIRDSQKEDMSLLEFTKKYTDIFMDDMEKLGNTSFNIYSPISEVIDDMVRMINTLLRKGHAYLADDGSIYYRVKSYDKYGQLARLDTKGMKSGVRINNDEYEKEEVGDFALWKGYNKEADGPNVWEVTFEIPDEQWEIQNTVVPGRPGWHIECSACNMHHHGKQIDIHMGGVDNLFPHHENEIAQTEACTGKQYVKYWLHTEHLLVDGKKMSKSANNFYTLEEIVARMNQYTEDTIYAGFRMMNLQNHYRSKFNFTFDRLESAIKTLERLDGLVKRIARYDNQDASFRKEFREFSQDIMQRFIEALEDDFNTNEALAVVFEYVTHIQKEIDSNTLSLAESDSVIDMLQSFDAVMNCIDFSPLEEEATTPEEIQELLDKRTQAKAEKDFTTADAIRDKIQEMGYNIIDDASGSFVEKS